MNDHFYITTTLPYVNAAPHIGFALEIIEADVIARYQRELLDKKVFFNTGSDEHGQKIATKAAEQNIEPQAYCDHWAEKFKELKALLNLSVDRFIRTTAADHISAAQEFWQRCLDKGDIYKAQYPVKYCVGCEMAKTESELVDGRCPLHPNRELEIREEENYFFKFSNYQQALLDLYEKNPEFVKPASRMKEIKAFVEGGLADFSISRLKKNMSWGIPVPGDDEHVMYVWFDALINYISTLGWPENETNFANFWPGVQVAGKDNLRQQAAMWQAMLLSADLPNSKQILINGFIGVDGQKMSKSLGNVISPIELVDRYGIDATRYLLIKLGTFGEDMDVSFEKLDTTYNAFLAYGIGNLCSRLAKMASTENLSLEYQAQLKPEFKQLMTNFDLSEALNWLDQELAQIDKYLAQKKPWTLSGEAKKIVLKKAIKRLLDLNWALQVFMPTTSQKIANKFNGQMTAFDQGLFARIS